MIKHAPKLPFIGANDIVEGIDFARMRVERAAKVKKAMKEKGIPAMLVTGVPNVRYLIGFNWFEYQPWLSYVLFFAEHEPVVFAHAGAYHWIPALVPHIKNWRIARATLQNICGEEAAVEEYQAAAKEIHSELKELGLEKEKLGIVAFDHGMREALRGLKLNVIEGWPLLLDAATTKTQDEINCIKTASAFQGVGWRKFMEIARVGMSTHWVHTQVAGAIQDAGSEHAGGGILSGPLTFPRCTIIVPRRIESGDLINYPLCGTTYMGYAACGYRSFKVGQRPTDKEKDWYKKLIERLDTLIEATKIGNTTADACKAFPPASYWGYKEETEVLTVEVGHGIGMVSLAPSFVSYNKPVVNRLWSPKHPQPFEEGMVIAYESLEGERGHGGVRVEHMVAVTKNGPEVLDFFPRDELIAVGVI